MKRFTKADFVMLAIAASDNCNKVKLTVIDFSSALMTDVVISLDDKRVDYCNGLHRGRISFNELNDETISFLCYHLAKALSNKIIS